MVDRDARMFPLYQTSGFYHAPVSKALVGGSVLASIALNFPLGHYRTWLRFSHSWPLDRYSLLRFVLCRCVFLDPKDIICAGVILYHFRIFERRYGSLKFASQVLCTFCLSLAVELAAAACLRQWELDLGPIPTGPFAMVFSLYIAYFCDIPRVAYTHMMGIPITGKSLTYIIGLQLLSGSIESSILAVIGLLLGVLVRCNFLWVSRWFRIPRVVAKLADATLGQLLHTPKPPEPRLPMGATLEIQRQQQMEQLEQQLAWAQLQPQQQGMFGLGLFPPWNQNRNHNGGGGGGGGLGPFFPGAAAPDQNNHQAAAPVVPSDEQVQRLVEMGFNRDNVLNALRASNNDVSVATNILLHET